MLNKELHLAISKAVTHSQEANISFLKKKDSTKVVEMLSIAKEGIEEAIEIIEASNDEERTYNHKSGIYLLRDGSYEKTVEASFQEGKLVRLVDKDGNNWIDWQRHVCWDEPRDTHQPYP